MSNLAFAARHRLNDPPTNTRSTTRNISASMTRKISLRSLCNSQRASQIAEARQVDFEDQIFVKVRPNVPLLAAAAEPSPRAPQ